MHPNILRAGGKRVYPVTDMPVPSQPMQQSNLDNRREKHHSVPIFHSPHQFVKEFSNLSFADKPSSTRLRDSILNDITKKYDVSLLGNTPMVEDLQLPLPTPNIPASVIYSILVQRK